MIRTVLVPLDRSPFGEQALAPAIAIARRAQAELRILHVRTVNPPLAFQYVDWWAEALIQEETEYLDKIAQRIRDEAGVEPIVEAKEGVVSDIIRRHASNVGADLIVMTTHGRTGLSRLWMGSVADAVVRQESTPVLLIRPEEHAAALDEHPLFSHVLIPLDGSPEAETILDDAVALGSLAHARYTLVRVVAPILVPAHPYAIIGSTTQADEDATATEIRGAREYLDQHVARLSEAGLRVESKLRVSDHFAAAILGVAHDVQADLIAMCTHRHGPARYILGSVADKVLRGGDVPVLLMHPRVGRA